jgi:ABC-2 type transport system permease protein
MTTVLSATHADITRTIHAPSTLALVRVEIRKLLDTRASLWIQAIVLLLCLAVTAAAFALPAEARSVQTFASYIGAVISLLMPVIAILSLTSEWANGSVVTSAVLIPRRWRTVGAKFVALTLFATAWTVVAFALASAATAIAAGTIDNTDQLWNLTTRDVFTFWLGIVLSTIMGAAFGAVFMDPAIGIVVYLVLPVAWTVVGQLVESAADLAQWLDSSITYSHLLDGSMDAARDWWEVAASTAVWVLVPLVIGLVRLARREVK